MSRPSLPTDLSQLAILLDIDGTILDLAATPRQVFVSHSLRQTLQRLLTQTGGAVALVSGRPLEELELLFAPLQLPAIGGHGAEMRLHPDSGFEIPPLPPLDPEIKRQFATIAELGPGILLEDKGYSLALHYRLAPELGVLVRAKAAELMAAHRGEPIEVLHGKSVLELKRKGVTKATAVRKLMGYPPFRDRRPIFIGDDITDRPVFEIMPEFNGFAVSVGPVSGVELSFDRPADVRLWLDQISRNHMVPT
ncbi:MAG: trehalose-phosphatase [Hyphomicrobiales bacterium]|nr:trehalose-phosphatase [Hyphomicrobiales bacterium]